MKMGNMSTIGVNQPKNLVHVLLDNNVHDSTGQQLTNASTVEFAKIAIVTIEVIIELNCWNLSGLLREYSSFSRCFAIFGYNLINEIKMIVLI